MSTIVDKAPAGVGLIGVTKRFSDVVAVDEVSLDIEPREFVSLLGPSGCGKTTTLRMIAGFEFPDEGDIMLGGRSILSTPPYRRSWLPLEMNARRYRPLYTSPANSPELFANRLNASLKGRARHRAHGLAVAGQALCDALLVSAKHRVLTLTAPLLEPAVQCLEHGR